MTKESFQTAYSVQYDDELRLDLEMTTEFGIIGTSIWQQNMALLEHLTLDRDSKLQQLEQLKEKLGLDELVYLSTCNRVEFLYVTSGKIRGRRVLHRLIDKLLCGQNNLSFFPNDFYHFTGKEAITHLFRTTSSLESLVVGETQITGQFKAAFEEASNSGLSGPMIDSLAKESMLTAKKVKRETSLGEGSLSMASLAAGELRTELESVENGTVALVGSGEMTVKMARYIRKHMKANLLFVNRTIDKAIDLAKQFDAMAVSLEDFKSKPGSIVAIVSATAAVDAVFDESFLDRLEKSDRKVVCVDLAIPRDFSLEFNLDERVMLIDIPALKHKGQGNLRNKFVESGKANDIVREAVNQFLSNSIESSLKPIFTEGYKESIQLAHKAFNDLFEKKVTSIGEDEKEAVLKLMTKLIGHSSFQPVKMLSASLVDSKTDIGLNKLAVGRKLAV